MARFDLSMLSKLATQLIARPELHEVFEAADSKSYEQIRSLALSPFFLWSPFWSD